MDHVIVGQIRPFVFVITMPWPCAGARQEMLKKRKKNTPGFSASPESAKVFSDSWLRGYERLVRCSVLIPEFPLEFVVPGIT